MTSGYWLHPPSAYSLTSLLWFRLLSQIFIGSDFGLFVCFQGSCSQTICVFNEMNPLIWVWLLRVLALILSFAYFRGDIVLEWVSTSFRLRVCPWWDHWFYLWASAPPLQVSPLFRNSIEFFSPLILSSNFHPRSLWFFSCINCFWPPAHNFWLRFFWFVRLLVPQSLFCLQDRAQLYAVLLMYTAVHREGAEALT